MSYQKATMRLFSVALSLILLSCASSPTGRSQLMLISPDEAISASSQAYQEVLAPIEEDGKLDNDPVIVERVRRITGRIVAQAIRKFPHTRDWEWSIKVIDDPDNVNAWCMAGGKMAIYTGLIYEIEPTDDELAQVLGHEVSHALANHTAEAMSIALVTELGLLGLALATDDSGGDILLSGATLAATLAIDMPNSRKAEREADQIGLELAARAGYNPYAAVSLWDKMEQMDESEGEQVPEWLSTHPSPDNRKQTLGAMAAGMMYYYRDNKERPVYQFSSLSTGAPF